MKRVTGVRIGSGGRCSEGIGAAGKVQMKWLCSSTESFYPFSDHKTWARGEFCHKQRAQTMNSMFLRICACVIFVTVWKYTPAGKLDGANSA